MHYVCNINIPVLYYFIDMHAGMSCSLPEVSLCVVKGQTPHNLTTVNSIELMLIYCRYIKFFGSFDVLMCVLELFEYNDM